MGLSTLTDVKRQRQGIYGRKHSKAIPGRNRVGGQLACKLDQEVSQK